MTVFFQQILEADHLPPVSTVVEIFTPAANVHQALGLHGIPKLISMLADIAVFTPVRFALYFSCLVLRTVSGRGSFVFNAGTLLVYGAIFLVFNEWFGGVLGVPNIF